MSVKELIDLLKEEHQYADIYIQDMDGNYLEPVKIITEFKIEDGAASVTICSRLQD